MSAAVTTPCVGCAVLALDTGWPPSAIVWCENLLRSAMLTLHRPWSIGQWPLGTVLPCTDRCPLESRAVWSAPWNQLPCFLLPSVAVLSFARSCPSFTVGCGR